MSSALSKLFFKKRRMSKKTMQRLGLSLVILLLVLPCGCSVVNKILPGDDYLRKRVMIFPFIDQADVGPERTVELSKEFYGLLDRSSSLILYKSPDGMYSSLAMNSPQFGVVTSSVLVDVAEQMGMTDLLIGVLNPIETSISKTGIWPFDSWKKIYVVSVAVNIIDIATKTLLLTQLDLKEFTVPLEDAENEDEEEYIKRVTAEALPEIMENLVEAVEDRLIANPFTGKILAIDEGTIMFNAGSEVGLDEGQVFDVYALGKAIPSAGGREVRLFGDKVGTIKTSTVMDKHALAEPLSGGPFKAGQIIRFQR
jgi:hypothetical protein